MTVAKQYRKKPVVIEAILLTHTAESIASVQKFIQNGVLDKNSCASASDAWDMYLDIVRARGGIEIKTLEGTHLASFGDYVIKGIAGEFYPCKPDIFKGTYEEV